jgi:Gly-Xaa carboxypeptidase
MLEAITGLLKGGFKPNRTLLLAFGIDEELMRNDNEGASKLAMRIEELYGPDGIEMILDEGGLGVQSLGDTKRLFVLPSLVEKGYLDVSIRLRTTGGHSSKPPRHTGIGIMADLITRLEAKGDPFQPDLASTDYTLTCLHCFADHAPSFSKKLSKLVKRGVSGRKLAQALVAEMPAWKPLVVNTQAVDVIRGGIKANVRQ